MCEGSNRAIDGRSKNGAGGEGGSQSTEEQIKESGQDGFIRGKRGGENSLEDKNVLQVTLRLEMIADHKETVAMETSSLQAML